MSTPPPTEQEADLAKTWINKIYEALSYEKKIELHPTLQSLYAFIKVLKLSNPNR